MPGESGGSGRTEVAGRIADFIGRELLKGRAGEVLDNTPLLDMGVLDSLGIFDLLGFIENSWAVAIPDDDVVPENFATVADIAALVTRRQDLGVADTLAANQYGQLIRLQESYGIRSSEIVFPEGARLHYLHTSGDEPPWMLLPGLGNPSVYWAPLMRSVSGQQRVLAPDLGGFGLSCYGGPHSPRFSDHVDVSLSMLTALELENIVLIGSSAGAMIAAEICRRVPQKIRALVVTGFGAIDQPHRWWERLRALSVDPAGFLQAAYHAPPQLTPILLGLLRDALSSAAFHSFLDESALASMPRCFDGLSVPTLFIAGESDTIIPRHAVEAAAAGVPGASLRWLARCGHFPPAEQPGAFLWYLQDFLDSLASREAGASDTAGAALY